MDRLEELRELVKVSKRNCEFVETDWREAGSENLSSCAGLRAEIVDTYKKKLREDAGHLLDFCADLMVGETGFMLDHFFKLCDLCETVLKVGEESVKRGSDTWYECLYFFANDFFNEMRRYEKQEREGTHKYTLSLDGSSVVEMHKTKNGGWKHNNYPSPRYSISMKRYCRLRDSFVYKLCSRLVDYYWETDVDRASLFVKRLKRAGREVDKESIILNCVRRDVEKEEFIAMVKTVCLFIALTNEELRLRNTKEIVSKAKGQKKQGQKGKTREEKWEDDTLTLAEKSKEWKNVFTSRAIHYFGKAISKGWMEEKPEYGYKWTDPMFDAINPIVFFYINVYKRDKLGGSEGRKPPYDKLEILFRIHSNLSNVASKLEGRTWYTNAEVEPDEMKLGNVGGREWYLKLRNFFKD